MAKITVFGPELSNSGEHDAKTRAMSRFDRCA
jgi:hypothetical protein